MCDFEVLRGEVYLKLSFFQRSIPNAFVSATGVLCLIGRWLFSCRISIADKMRTFSISSLVVGPGMSGDISNIGSV